MTAKKDKAAAASGGRKLNAKQQRFVDEYLIDLNGSQAAIRAGYSAKTANRIASRLLSNVDIQAGIQAGRERTSQELQLSRDDCILQYQRLGFSDVRKLYDAYGRIKPITELDDDTAAAIQGIEVEYRKLDGPDDPPVAVLKIKLADRKGALDSIMRAQGWNSAEKHEHTGQNGGPLQVVNMKPEDIKRVMELDDC